MTYLYLVFSGDRFVQTCHSYGEALDLSKHIKDPYIKRVVDVDR